MENFKSNIWSTKILRRVMSVLLLSLAIALQVMATTTTVQQQGIRVTGTVSDDRGEALPGVSVVVKSNPSTGTATDANISTINPSDLKIPSSNLTTALAGRMSGVIAFQTSGEPGRDNAEFFIRGVTTFGYKIEMKQNLDFITKG